LIRALLALLLAAPPTLGDALRAVGAFAPERVTVDTSLTPPPPPPRTGAKVLIGTGAAMFVAGLAGTIGTPHCATRDADQRCTDYRGAYPVFPALVVAGVAAAIAGSAWYRRDAAPER
jgi:hypothetical protein